MSPSSNSRALGLLVLLGASFSAWADAPDDAPANVNGAQHYESLSVYEKRIQLLNKQADLYRKKIEVMELSQQLRSMESQPEAVPLPEPSAEEKAEPAAPDPLKKMSVYAITGAAGKMRAEIRYGNGIIPVQVGDTLPGKWTVKTIGVTGVEVARGSRTESIPMPDKVSQTSAGYPVAPLLPLPPPPTQ